MAHDQAIKRLIEISVRGYKGEYIDTTEVCRKCPATLPQVCCKYPIPVIPISDEEVTVITQRTKKDPSEFVKKYGNQIFLKKPCIFLKGWKCTIHEIKPKQCRGAVCIYGSRHLVRELPPPQKSVEDAVKEAIYDSLSRAGIETDTSIEVLIENYVKAVKPRKPFFSFLSKFFSKSKRKLAK